MTSAFRTQLETRDLADDRFELLAPLVYYSEHLQREITVPKGFVTDFASVPRLPVAYLLAGGEANQAAVVHDYLYHSHLVPRADADAVFEEAMGVTGQPWWRCKLMWAGVRMFGAGPYEERGASRGLAPDLDNPKGESQ